MQQQVLDDTCLGWRDLEFFKKGGHEWIMNKIEHSDFLPYQENIYKSLILTPRKKVRVVILGQDPYPGYDRETQLPYACGLAFSVDKRIRNLPASLRNVLEELQNDLFIPFPTHGDLTSWAVQGVLLLNTCLTIIPGRSLSHADLGWSSLTSEIVQSLDDCVWLLWGKHAISYEGLIRNPRMIIKSPHPSPFSANKGFFGSRPFSRANSVLNSPINWDIN